MEPEFKSYIFKESERKNLLKERKHLIGWIVLLLSILLLLLEFYALGLSLAAIVLIASWGMAIDRWNRVEPLNGSFPLRLTINLHEIKIGDKSYGLNKISLDKLICDDYKGRPTRGHVLFIQHPAKSNGTWNHLWFTCNQQEYRLRFKIDSKSQSQQLEKIKPRLGIR